MHRRKQGKNKLREIMGRREQYTENGTVQDYTTSQQGTLINDGTKHRRKTGQKERGINAKTEIMKDGKEERKDGRREGGKEPSGE